MAGKKISSKKKGNAQSCPPEFVDEVLRIQRALSLDLLHPDYDTQGKAAKRTRLQMACTGHCYVATEAAYHLFAKRARFVPYVRKNDGGTHWWLEHLDSGQILDPTEPQLPRRAFPYQEGHRQPFRTKQPSKRAKELIRRVKAAKAGKY